MITPEELKKSSLDKCSDVMTNWSGVLKSSRIEEDIVINVSSDIIISHFVLR